MTFLRANRRRCSFRHPVRPSCGFATSRSPRPDGTPRIVQDDCRAVRLLWPRVRPQGRASSRTQCREMPVCRAAAGFPASLGCRDAKGHRQGAGDVSHTVLPGRGCRPVSRPIRTPAPFGRRPHGRTAHHRPIMTPPRQRAPPRPPGTCLSLYPPQSVPLAPGRPRRLRSRRSRVRHHLPYEGHVGPAL